ncbi:MAG: phage/plasmid primase, P4 family, partial [Clostridia bacterium]|nr:phage/plasmid primase, P4 family [Clostridia bacterium]
AMRGILQYDGLGIHVMEPLVVVYVDHCVTNGVMNDLACEIIDLLPDAYIEYSPSGTGMRAVFLAKGFAFDKARWYVHNQKKGIEVYVGGATAKFATITGDVIQHNEMKECGEALQVFLNRYMKRAEPVIDFSQYSQARSLLSDESVLAHARDAKNGEAFSALFDGDITDYGSQSEADLALCSMLAFWCGRDRNQMDRLFRQSGLYREKWDRAQSGSSYGAITLNKAAVSVKEVYSPLPRIAAHDEFSDLDDTVPDLSALHPDTNPRYAWTDIGGANLFADCFRATARFVPERKMWYIYDGCVWRPDTGNLRAMQLCKKLADQLLTYAVTIADESLREQYIGYARKWQLRRAREIILKDAADVYPIEMAQFDRDKYLFNVRNGTVDLRDGGFRAHRPDDMITKCAAVAFDPTARCERWECFINEVMCGDDEKAGYFQKALGYSLTGDTRYECLFIVYGKTTRNGKSSALETILTMLGDYGRTSRPETIAVRQMANSSGPSEDIARLAGVRFVNINELDRKLSLSASTVKSLTGNDSICARYLNENSFTFKPAFKLFINTNYLPVVSDMTLFTSGRLKIIPFDRHFGEEEQDKSLKTTLALPENLSGILNWCLEGWKKLCEEGFDMPASIRRATEDYHSDSDKLALFIEDMLVKDDHGEVRTAAVYEVFANWCRDNGYCAESKRSLNAMLHSVATIERKRPKSGGDKTTMLLGYRLKPGITVFTSPID